MNALALFNQSRTITDLRQAGAQQGTGGPASRSLTDIFEAIRTSQRVTKPAGMARKLSTLSGEADLEIALKGSRTSFKVLVSRVSMHLGVSWLEKLFAQIDSLLDVDEWDASDPVPNTETARTFIRLLLAMKVSRRPGLGVSNSGNIVAAWTAGPNRLTVECLPNDRVRWVLARVTDGETERAAGDGKIERLREILGPYTPAVWFEYAD
uniref:hypothetical protein n=1 Tax=uncultured Rhizobium sp. TaxID=155567 RepID=UPI00262ACF8B|nr:hypothetical protein [uncultured Rhizobium sp.]